MNRRVGGVARQRTEVPAGELAKPPGAVAADAEDIGVALAGTAQGDAGVEVLWAAKQLLRDADRHIALIGEFGGTQQAAVSGTLDVIAIRLPAAIAIAGPVRDTARQC